MMRADRGITAVCGSVFALAGFIALLAPQRSPAQEEQEQKTRRQIQKQLSEDPAWRSTHKDVRAISMGDAAKRVAVHTFCLNRDGNLLVGCGGPYEYYEAVPAGSDNYVVRTINDPAEIRVVSPEGKLLATWAVDVKPEAIGIGADGTVFVGGDGKIAKLDGNGKMLASAVSPVLAEPKSNHAAAQPPQKRKSVSEALTDLLFGSGTSRQEEEAMARAAEARSREVNAIAVSPADLFVACPQPTGFGFAVYRMDHDLKNPVLIVNGLRGCCGQMDIQTKDGDLWIAENGQHRVRRCDRNGKEIASFGKHDRVKPDGFGGCCEPKNLRFGPAGELYTCESGPPVAVKRFALDGKFLGVVGVADFYTGCVRVTVDVSADGHRVFVLNNERGAIHVLEDRRAEPRRDQKAAPSAAKRKTVIESF
jgi:hypothetical protein